jgi:pimeloyl-ACP methyl ester carboxylesterase
VLLLICGGIYDTAGYARLASELADHYTVVTYDRRGNSRSPLDGPRESQIVEVHADDAHRVLTAVGVTADDPAYVFGNSSGAMIGLALATNHSALVRVVAAHEPPLLDMLSDREHWHEVIARVEEIFQTAGAMPAMGTFAAKLGMNPRVDYGRSAERGDDAAPIQPDPESIAIMERINRNVEFFIGYEAPPFCRWVPDLPALRSSPVRVVPLAGEASEGEPAHRGAVALADALGTRMVRTPGDHSGFGAEPAAFATRVIEVLSGA